MQPLILYPSEKKSKTGFGIGIASFAAGALIWAFGGSIETQILWMLLLGGGVYMMVVCGRQLVDKRPVFEADAHGFSVKGGGRRPWSDFRGVEVYTGRSGSFVTSRTVRIKTGKTFLGGAKSIKCHEMSGLASEMMLTIARYAEEAKHSAVASEAKYTVPPVGFDGAAPFIGARAADFENATPPATSGFAEPAAPFHGAEPDFGTPDPTFARLDPTPRPSFA